MFDKVLSMPPVLNSPGFWICLWFWTSQKFRIYQGSEYASGFEYLRILNIPEFWICQGYTGFRICLNKSWICLNMSDYVWICQSMPVYSGICVNMTQSAWMAFVLHFLISRFALKPLFYLKTWFIIWTSTGD